MTDLAPRLAAFLQNHLPRERRLSRHTVQSYTESFKLPVLYAAERLSLRPCALMIEHFTVALLVAFLEHLEQDRHNSVGTRNTRLAAIKSFFRYLEYRVPSCLDLPLQVRAVPHKRAGKPLVAWLDRSEMQAVLDAPDTSTVPGLRDRAMLHLCYAAGLRVSELTALTLDSLSQPRLESIHILGKGRRERELPLWSETRTVLSEWLEVRPSVGNRYLFLNARGRALSRDGFAYRLDLHVAAAGRAVPSLAAKRVTPHVLRHSDGNDRPARYRGHREGLAVAGTCRHEDHRAVPSCEPRREARDPRSQHAAVHPAREVPGGTGQPDAPTKREETAGIMPSESGRMSFWISILREVTRH